MAFSKKENSVFRRFFLSALKAPPPSKSEKVYFIVVSPSLIFFSEFSTSSAYLTDLLTPLFSVGGGETIRIFRVFLLGRSELQNAENPTKGWDGMASVLTGRPYCYIFMIGHPVLTLCERDQILTEGTCLIF